MFILAGLGTFTAISVAVCCYIAVTNNRCKQVSNTVTENHAFLLVSTKEDTSPTSTGKCSEVMKDSNTEAANEKEREAMEEEEEQRYQPQEAIFVTPSKEPEGDVKA